MSWIKEAFESVQDLIAPELRAIGSKVDALAARIAKQARNAEKLSMERHLEIKSDIAALRTKVALRLQVAMLMRQVAELTSARESKAQ